MNQLIQPAHVWYCITYLSLYEPFCQSVSCSVKKSCLYTFASNYYLQFVSNLSTNCLSVFDDFVDWRLKG